MCGICGVYSYRSGEPASADLVRSMSESLRHRGPDDDGLYLSGSLGLGVRRLSIIDVAGGHQPMCNEDSSVWIAFNGEIYGYRDLRDELVSRGHVFRTLSDTETIVHAYEEWGVDAIGRLNGMFGLALWDAKRKMLVLARDPFGVKPLYYWERDGRLLFGSEIRAILCDPAVERCVDLEALDQFVALSYVPSPRTAFRDIWKLPPGHMAICDRDGVRIERFDRRAPQPIENASEAELVDRLQAALASAVGRQMVADVPVGAMLSGGLDSSTVVSIMSELAPSRVDTFTVGFGPEFAFDELREAEAVALARKTNHHDLVISASEYEAFLPEAIEHLEEPVATTSTLAFFRLCQLARRHVKVALVGQGADELFGGYPRHLGERYGGVYRTIPAAVRNGVIAPLIELLPRSEQLKRAARSLGSSDSRQRMEGIYTIVEVPLRQRLYRDGLLNADKGMPVLDRWNGDVAGLDSLGQMLYVESRLSLSDNLLLYGDKLSMAVSLEVRVPFLDLELASFVESIPTRYKIRGREQKRILKLAAAKWLPREVIKRKKVGFATPLDQWFRRELTQSLEDRLLATDSACREFFEPAVIRQLIEQHRSGRQDYKRVLFELLTFEIWHELFMRKPR